MVDKDEDGECEKIYMDVWDNKKEKEENYGYLKKKYER